MTDIALLTKTEIIAKTPHGQAMVVISKTDQGYSCGLWGGDPAQPTYLGDAKFSQRANFIEKAQVVGGLLNQAKGYLEATADKYPEGLDVQIRVEHNGKTHSVNGKLPLDKNQVSQLVAIVDWVKQVNAVVGRG